jgi:hypothetical protein
LEIFFPSLLENIVSKAFATVLLFLSIKGLTVTNPPCCFYRSREIIPNQEGRFKIGRGTIKKFLEKNMHTVYKNRQVDIFQGVE